MNYEQPELPFDDERDLGEFPPLEPQEITCSGGLKLDFAAMIGRRTEQESPDGE